MPVMDGLVAAEKIAGSRLAAVVILTAFSQRDLVERARAAGAMAYLVKPLPEERPGARNRGGAVAIPEIGRWSQKFSLTSKTG